MTLCWGGSLSTGKENMVLLIIQVLKSFKHLQNSLSQKTEEKAQGKTSQTLQQSHYLMAQREHFRKEKRKRMFLHSEGQGVVRLDFS